MLNASDLGLNNGLYQFLTQGASDCSVTATGISGPLPPVVNIQASLTSGCAPLLVNFGFTVTGGNIQVPHWDFGDGASFIWAQPAHIFWEPGSYTVTMTATSLSGCVTTDTLVIDVANCTSIGEVVDTPGATVRQDGDHLSMALDAGWSGEVLAELVSADGRIVRSKSVTGHSQTGSVFDLSGVPAGVLVLRLTSTRHGWTHRFVRI